MHLKTSLHAFCKGKEAVAAIEFAFIGPVMLLLLLMGVDLANHIRTTVQISRVANTMAQLLSSRSAAVSVPVAVVDNDLLVVMQSAIISFPNLLTDASTRKVSPWKDMNVVVSSISFMPGPSNCSGTSCTTYDAKVVWSSPLGNSLPRACGVGALTPAASTASPSAAILPADVYPAAGTGVAGTPMGNIIVIDVTYTDRSLWNVGSALTLQTPITKRSVFIAPRYTLASQNGINYTGPSTFTTICP